MSCTPRWKLGYILDSCISWFPLRVCSFNLILAQPWLTEQLGPSLGTFRNRISGGSLYTLVSFILQSSFASVQRDM